MTPFTRVRPRRPRKPVTVEDMWDTVTSASEHLSHDRPCVECGHGQHTYLPCSESCQCIHGRVLAGSSS